MTIVIPEDDNINEIVVDVRDVLYGAELEFDAEKEFRTVFNSKSDIINNNFATEFVFTIQKSDFKFRSNEESFLLNFKKVAKKIKPEILSIINRKFIEMKKLLENGAGITYRSYKRGKVGEAGLNRRFLRHIREQYSNIVDSGHCGFILMKKGEKVILGEKVFKSSLQLLGVSAVSSSKKLGLDTPNLKNIKITELGLCDEKLLDLTINNITKGKKSLFKFNKYIENIREINQDNIEI